MGAIATGGFRVLNEEVIALKGISEQMIAAVAAREQNELKRREEAYRGHAASPHISGKTIILVDDGIATGSTMRAAGEERVRRDDFFAAVRQTEVPRDYPFRGATALVPSPGTPPEPKDLAQT